MIEVLEPLTRIAGVRAAALVSTDGVPVVARGVHVSQSGSDCSIDDNPEALAALATGWLNGLVGSVAPLSWEAPHRVVLRAARGTLVMSTVTGALLLILLDTGVSAEELRLPMEAAVARLKRVLRCARAAHPRAEVAPAPATPRTAESNDRAPDAPLPARAAAHGVAQHKGPAPVSVDTSRKHSPREFPG